MTKLRLVHWNDREARARVAVLTAAGYEVVFEPLRDQAALRRVREDHPDVVLIDLTRLPAQGRDLALWLRQQKSTRHLPLVFLGGTASKVKRIRQLLPDAVYSEWEKLADAVQTARALPAAEPVVPESVFAGYSGTPLPKKLGIKAGSVVALVNAPRDFADTLGPLPSGVELRPSGRGRRSLTLCFVASQRDLGRRIDSLVRASEQGPVWIAWPKKTSGVVTDLSQTQVRRTGLDAGLVDYKICAIDDTWSGLCFALRREC